MESKDFYLTLPSNSSLQHFPDNTLSSFKVLLPRRINLSSDFDWEIGLSEIQYPLSLKSVGSNGYLIVGINAEEVDAADIVGEDNGRVEKKYFNNVQIMTEQPIETIVALSEKSKKQIYFKYDANPPKSMSQAFQITSYLNEFLNKQDVIKNYLLKANKSPNTPAIKFVWDKGGKYRTSQLDVILSSEFKGLNLYISPLLLEY